MEKDDDDYLLFLEFLRSCIEKFTRMRALEILLVHKGVLGEEELEQLSEEGKSVPELKRLFEQIAKSEEEYKTISAAMRMLFR
jgi:hypothetical protein